MVDFRDLMKPHPKSYDRHYEICLRCNETKQEYRIGAVASPTLEKMDHPAFKAMMRAKFEIILEKLCK